MAASTSCDLNTQFLASRSSVTVASPGEFIRVFLLIFLHVYLISHVEFCTVIMNAALLKIMPPVRKSAVTCVKVFWHLKNNSLHLSDNMPAS